MTTSEYLDHSKRVPSWMSFRVMKLAIERSDIEELRGGIIGRYMKVVPRSHLIPSLYELEYTALGLLHIDLRFYPVVSNLVPEEFLKAIRNTHTAASLAPRERASIVINAAEARECGQERALFARSETADALTRLKWEALNSLLTEEAGDA